MNSLRPGDVLRRLEARYYDGLGLFKEVCLELIEARKPYQAVLMCHDLMRYLYPTEPFAKVRHDDPVPFLVEQIDTLVRFGRLAASRHDGYPDPTAGYDREAADTAIEKSTSDFYSRLWQDFDRETLVEESRHLVSRRIAEDVFDAHVRGRSVLDMGCGSGRYAIALAALGARTVTAVDFQEKSYAEAKRYCEEAKLPVTFRTTDVLALPFADGEFDFVFCNGVLHHTRSWRKGLAEIARVMKGAGFIYVYAAGGFLWNTRDTVRAIMKTIPEGYARAVLRLAGMPANRFFFMDSWFVPIEEHVPRAELESTLTALGLAFRKLVSRNPHDLDYGLALGVPGGEIAWGEGEHRYLLIK